MDEIREIYSGESYSGFLHYCELHHYRRMCDLVNCRFEELTERAGVSPALLSRIKTIYHLYLKKHPDCLIGKKPAKARPAPDTGDLAERLQEFFEQNKDRLIHISEISREVGKGIKRGDLLLVLGQQKWCRMVDQTTFFYAPE